MQFTQSNDGTRIAYETHGGGNLKMIVLHGWGGSSSYWRDLVSHLNLQGLQVIAPSYRGHGDSEKPAQGYTLDGFAEDVLAVADSAEAQRFVLVGLPCGHEIPQEMPEQTAPLVEAFLSGLGHAAGTEAAAA